MEANGGINMAQFPKEAANLHALVDESLSRADAVAVQMAQRTAQRAVPAAAHQQGLSAAASPAKARPAFPPKGWTPGAGKGEEISEANVNEVMERLRRVKTFSHHHSVAPLAAPK